MKTTTPIEPTAVYFAADLVRLFGFTRSTLKTARNRTGLRVGKRMGRHFVLGSWLLEWFAAGELPSRASAEPVHSGRRPTQGG